MAKLLRDLSEWSSAIEQGAVSIGDFDGVHLGHATLVKNLVSEARRLGGPAIVFTFDPPPTALLRPGSEPPRLTTLERRTALLGELGVDWVLAFPTDHATLQLTAAEFFNQFLVRRLKARSIVEGANFRFGRGRAGDIELLRELCGEARCELKPVALENIDGNEVSSSRIRQWLRDGDLATANRWLTAPYRLQGEVGTGAQRGRTIGFPTANLQHPQTLVPGVGVYAARAHWEGKTAIAAVNVGGNPTFGEQQLKIEAHLLDFQGDLYGKTMELEFFERIRPVKTFSSIDELKAQLKEDLDRVATRGAAWASS